MTRVVYRIDYRSPPSGFGQVTLADGSWVEIGYGPDYERTGEPDWGHEGRELRRLGVTHVIDTEAGRGETLQDLYEPIPIDEWRALRGCEGYEG